jgi:hypothetical protein
LTSLVPGVFYPQSLSNNGIVSLAGGDQLTITLGFLAADAEGSPWVDGQHLIVPDGARDGFVRDPAWLLMTNAPAASSPIPSDPDSSPSQPSQKSGGGCDTGIAFSYFNAASALAAVFLCRRRTR